MENKLELPPEMDKSHSPQLPPTLEVAIEKLQEDKAICAALGEEFIEWFVTAKGVEMEKLKPEPNEDEETSFRREREMYFHFL